MKHNENELSKKPEQIDKIDKYEEHHKAHPNYHKEVSQSIADQELDDSDEPEF